MADINNLITDNINVWTSAIKKRNAVGRGSSKKIELTGIKKLRELILELAVRGKLVPQDANDEPASVLLDNIAAEKTQLLKDKLIKKPKKLAEITKEDKAIPLPHGWEFVRLNDLGEWGAGATPPRGNSELYGGDIPWFKSGELNGDYIESSDEMVTELALKQASLRYNKVGDVLLAMYGATIGKTSILKVRATTNQAVCACTPFTGFSNIFLLTLLKAYRPKFIGMGVGGAQPNISREKIIATVIALPPLAEQHRIVAKVDELMVLCDQLEQQTEESLSAHQVLVEVLLSTLTESKNAVTSQENFQTSWQRIAEHFDLLFTTEQSIEQLKQTILQLAVMGKLVPQKNNEDPAVELIKKDKYEMYEDIVKCGSLPSGWVWTALGNFANCERGRFSIRPRNDPSCYGGEHPFIQIGDLPKFGGVIDCHKQTLNEKGLTVSKKFPENTIVIAIVGATIGNTGMLGYDMCFPDSMVGINTGTRIGNSYLELYLRSLKYKIRSVAYAGGGQPNIKLQILNPLPILVPPLAEQHRIVAKVDELMALCDQLKARLSDAQTTQLHLADAVVENALSAHTTDT